MPDDKITCSLKYLMNIFGGKWKLPIICILSDREPHRYSEIKRRLGDITNTMLAKSLRELEASGFVDRQEYDEKILRVEYSLTEKGTGALPMLTAAAEWALKEIAIENLKPYCGDCTKIKNF